MAPSLERKTRHGGAPQAPGYFFQTLDKTSFTRKKIDIEVSFLWPSDDPMGPCTHPMTPGFLGPLVA